MNRITPIAKDHEAILEGLNVLKLIAVRVEAGEIVDPEDIAIVLSFLRDIGCACLDHTAALILRPALERAKERADVARLRTALACHQTVPSLLEDTVADLEVFRSFFVSPSRLRKRTSGPFAGDSVHFIGETQEEFPSCFLLHARLLTKLVSDLIVEEDRALLQNAIDLLSDSEGRRMIEEFANLESHINAIAVERSPTLWLLEAKYSHPRTSDPASA
jgi:hypothetical protein